MPDLRIGLTAAIMVLALAACGETGPAQPATDPDRTASAATPEQAAPEPAGNERPWMLGLRWKGPDDQRVEFDVTYYLEGQLGIQDQTTTPRARSDWSYMIGSPWVKGMVVAGRMDTGAGPVTAELIRARTVSESPVIETDDDVEIDAVLATMTVSEGSPATMEAGTIADDD